jgi:dihydroorotase
MSAPYDLVVRGAECVLPDGVARTDIGIRDGRIGEIGDLANVATEQAIDAKGLHVLPGVIDTQVHFREPGNEHKEDLDSGTRAAILGGVTAVFEMPNTSPATTTAEALGDKLARAKDRAWCDYAFYVGATPENAGDLADLERLPGCCGVKVFMGSSTGTLLVADDDDLAQVVSSGHRRFAVHAEDEDRLIERKAIAEAAADVHAHPDWRDPETALRATRRIVGLAAAADRPVHVLHVTTAEEMAFLNGHAINVSVEVTPQHLTLTAPECYADIGTLAQMNPPIRDARHRDALWVGVSNGTVTVIGSDHAPHTREEKSAAYPNTPSGMPGVQTLLPIMLDHVNAGRLTLERLVELVSSNPARLFGIKGKGRLVKGNDGDLTLVDLSAPRTITDDWIASRCGWTPFNGRMVTGWPVATVIRGRVVMREDEVIDKPTGAPLRFG